MKYHYIYKITLLCGSLKDHYYIGKHTVCCKPENCGYAGSGKILTSYYKTYPFEEGVTARREILELNETKQINAEREKYWIGDKWKTDPLCINVKPGGDGGGASIPKSEETKQKISATLMGHAPFNPQYKHSEETKKKIAESNTGKPSWNKGGISPMRGRHHSEETRKLISEKLKGRAFSEDTKERMREAAVRNGFKKGTDPWNKGGTFSDETKAKISAALKGRKVPPEVIEKRVQTIRGRKNNPEAIEKMRKSKEKSYKPIYCIDGDRKTWYCSIAKAAEDTHTNRTSLIQCLKKQNGRTHAGGYRWEYA